MVKHPVSSGISKQLCRHISQEVCPWNVRFTRELKEPAFAVRKILAGRDARTLARELLAMSREQFSAAFKGSPMKRATLRGLKRNAAVLLGNKDGAQDIDVRRRALDDREPNGCVCHAVRALGSIVTALPTPCAGAPRPEQWVDPDRAGAPLRRSLC